MKSLIVQGLKITTNCDYIRFVKSKFLKIVELNNVFELYFPSGFDSKNIIHKRIEFIYPHELEQTDFIKIVNPILDLSGCKIRKLCSGLLNYNQLIVKDIDEFIVKYTDYKVDILIPASKQDDLDTYVKCINSIPYLEVVEFSNKDVFRLSNYFSINIGEKDQKFDKHNHYPFQTKAFYDNYSLRMIDVVYSFVDKLSKILDHNSIQLVGLPIDENVLTNDYVVYRIVDLGDQVSHKTDYDLLRYAVQHRTNLEFELSTTNFILYNDFKTKFQNLDFVTNFTEFYTEDKYGTNWISCVKWGEITTEFNQEFDQDQQGNFAYKATFTCELYYYVVYDETFNKITQIILDIIDGMDSRSSSFKETINIK